MNIEKKETYTLITPSEENFQLFHESFKNAIEPSNSDHVIIDFSDNFNTKLEEISLFLDIAMSFYENKASFIIIAKGIDIDEIPDEITIVPTITEAIDTLEMDTIERDLMDF